MSATGSPTCRTTPWASSRRGGVTMAEPRGSIGSCKQGIVPRPAALMSSPVKIAITPDIFLPRFVSIEEIRAWACGERRMIASGLILKYQVARIRAVAGQEADVFFTARGLSDHIAVHNLPHFGLEDNCRLDADDSLSCMTRARQPHFQCGTCQMPPIFVATALDICTD